MPKETIVYRESPLRSILKAISWRILATLTTFTIVYLVTGETKVASSVAGIEIVTKMIVYYLHERAWQLLPRGTVRRWLKQLSHRKD